MPLFLRTPGVNHHQDATTGRCFLEGEGNVAGVGVSSFPDTEDDLAEP